MAAPSLLIGLPRGVSTGYTLPMTAPPAFASNQEFGSRLGDAGFWWPHISVVLERHGLTDAEGEPVAGFNPTYPTFLYGDVVVKLFGYSRWWRESHGSERAALALVATDPGIRAPRLVGEGRLYEDAEESWPYLITTRISGVPWRHAELSTEQRFWVAGELGRQVRRLHRLYPAGEVTHGDWSAGDEAAAPEGGSLPPHLVAQIDDYLVRLGPLDRVFVHGDLTADHAFVEEGSLAGIIDWGDAMVTDRHYELGKLYFEMFQCNKELLRVFLDGSDWPVGRDFPRQALGLALYRQAVGLAQHRTFDVFEPVGDLLPLQDISTIDELATELFGV